MELVYDGPVDAPLGSCRLRLYSDPSGPGRVALLYRVRPAVLPGPPPDPRRPTPSGTALDTLGHLATGIVARFGLDPAAVLWVHVTAAPRPSRRIFCSLVEFQTRRLPRLKLYKAEATPLERDLVESLVDAPLPDPDAESPDAP